MKKVLAIYSNGNEFKQYLLISEVKYIPKMCEDFGAITVRLVEITIANYKATFGK